MSVHKQGRCWHCDFWCNGQLYKTSIEQTSNGSVEVTRSSARTPTGESRTRFVSLTGSL